MHPCGHFHVFFFFDIFHFLVLFQSKARLRGKSSWHSPATIQFARRYVGIYLHIYIYEYLQIYVHTLTYTEEDTCF